VHGSDLAWFAGERIQIMPVHQVIPLGERLDHKPDARFGADLPDGG
jgi:hypothetical protein